MNRSEHLKRIPVYLFCLTLAAFLCFFIYVCGAESVSVDCAEPIPGYGVFENVTSESVQDDAAPAGIRKIYRGTLPAETFHENYFCFEISHHNIEVYFGDELVYSLSDSGDNGVLNNVGSNWCIVPVDQNHVGKEVTVILTPLFEAAVSKTPSFLLGSPHTLTVDILIGELPLLALSSLCILIGIFMIAVFLYFRFIIKTDNKEIVYLGFFSVSIGLWKLTDLYCAALLVPEHSVAINYLSVSALFLTPICLIPYFTTLFEKGKQKVLWILSCVSSAVYLAVLFAQITGIAEIRQNLIYSHILLVISLSSVPATVLVNRIVYKTAGLRRSWKLLLLLFAGIILDLIFYYRNNENGLMSFSIMSLIIYTLIIFLFSVQDSARKAYTDSRTGLVNRTRWMELMNEDTSASNPYAVLMIDMNGLKQINDTYGHDAGDEMIFRLSDILRKTLPSSAVICRWGGDEFAVLLADTNRAHLELQIAKLFSESEKYNAEHPELPLHFAVGAVLSSEHPEASRQELFRLADDEMYRNKKIWYSQQ